MATDIIPIDGYTRKSLKADLVKSDLLKINSLKSTIDFDTRCVIQEYIIDHAIVHPKCCKCCDIACSDDCCDKCDEELINWIHKTVLK